MGNEQNYIGHSWWKYWAYRLGRNGFVIFTSHLVLWLGIPLAAAMLIFSTIFADRHPLVHYMMGFNLILACFLAAPAFIDLVFTDFFDRHKKWFIIDSDDKPVNNPQRQS